MATRKTAAQKAAEAEAEAPMALAEESKSTEVATSPTTLVIQEQRPIQELLPRNADMPTWKPQEYAIMEQLGLVNRKNWKGAQPDAPLGFIESFLSQCRRTELDPLARQIYGMEYGGKWTVLISIDGFRVIAQRSREYRGQTQPQWCGPDGIWRDVWLSDEAPAAARIGVYREGFAEPVMAVATYAGYCPRDFKTKQLKPSNQWETNPSNQLLKVAEMLALRKAFPNDLSGLYGTEEMDQARDATSTPASAQRPAQRPAQADTAPPAPPVNQVEMRAPKGDWFDQLREVTDMEGLRKLYETVVAAGDYWVGVKNPLEIPGQPEFVPLGEYLMSQRSRFQKSTPSAPEGKPQAGDRMAQAQAGINHQEASGE